jgi:hypothetical protein
MPRRAHLSIHIILGEPPYAAYRKEEVQIAGAADVRGSGWQGVVCNDESNMTY